MLASALAKHPLSSSDCIQSGTQMILVETKIVLFLMTLNDLEGMNILEGYSPVAGLFKCRSSNICAAIYKILTVVMDLVMRKSMNGDTFGIRWESQRLTNLDFADDIALLAEHTDTLQNMTNQLSHQLTIPLKFVLS